MTYDSEKVRNQKYMICGALFNYPSKREVLVRRPETLDGKLGYVAITSDMKHAQDLMKLLNAIPKLVDAAREAINENTLEFSLSPQTKDLLREAIRAAGEKP